MKMQKRTPLVFLMPSLAGGGAERVAATLAPFLAGHFDLTLALLQDRDVYELPDRVRKVCFSGPVTSAGFHLLRIPVDIYALVRLVRRTGARTVLSFMEQANIINLLAAYSTGHRAIISQRTDPRLQYRNKGLLGKVIVRSCRHLYPRCDTLISVSEGIRCAVEKDYGLGTEQLTVIANPVDVDRLRQLGREMPSLALPSSFLIHVGRLDMATKRQDFLIAAFSHLHEDFPDLHLVLLGEGPDRPRLEEHVRQRGLAGRVLFAGWQENVASFVKRARALVLCSSYEGWPNVLVEAMSLGCPVVATNGPPVCREIIGEDEYGLLVPDNDVQALADACAGLAGDKEQRERYGRLGESRARRFDLPNIGRRYLEVLNG